LSGPTASFRPFAA